MEIEESQGAWASALGFEIFEMITWLHFRPRLKQISHQQPNVMGFYSVHFTETRCFPFAMVGLLLL